MVRNIAGLANRKNLNMLYSNVFKLTTVPM
jgi:hypothetical protein